jgi:hypothetical protein
MTSSGSGSVVNIPPGRPCGFTVAASRSSARYLWISFRGGFRLVGYSFHVLFGGDKLGARPARFWVQLRKAKIKGLPAAPGSNQLIQILFECFECWAGEALCEEPGKRRGQVRGSVLVAIEPVFVETQALS